MTVTSTRSTTMDTGLVQVTGGRPLSGRIPVQGSKNIALHLYAAALLADVPVALTGAPDIIDTGVCAQILRHTGAEVTYSDGRFALSLASNICPVIHSELGRQVRTTAVLAAAVLARAGQVAFPYPGGDAFCPRLIDRHLAAMQAAGAEVIASDTGIRALCGPGGIRAFTADVNTPYGPSLGATVTAMLLASRAHGASLITTPSIEPEVTETARFLADRGVLVHFDQEGLHVSGSDWIGGGDFAVAGDRIEAATMVMAAAVTGGSVHLDNITTAALPDGLTRALTEAGITLTDDPSGGVRSHLHGPLSAVEAATGPHPDLPTDTAPQLTAMLTQARGASLIAERIYPRRDTHVQGLRAFGADITTTGSVIRVQGPVPLHGATVEAADIRAVTALLIAALAADGTSTIRGMFHLRRGYGHLLPNLATLGAEITTIPEAPDARPVHRRRHHPPLGHLRPGRHRRRHPWRRHRLRHRRSNPQFLTCGVVAPECGDAEPDQDTTYDIASLTKVLATWPLIGQILDTGLLDLDAPIRDFLPPMNSETPSGDATVRQLLAHTSGLRASTRLDHYRGAELPLHELLCREPFEDAPGQHRYINRGYILLGLANAHNQQGAEAATAQLLGLADPPPQRCSPATTSWRWASSPNWPAASARTSPSSPSTTSRSPRHSSRP